MNSAARASNDGSAQADGDAMDGIRARLEGIVARGVSHRVVLVCGVGSIGSQFAELLVRCSIGRLTLMDADVVEPANLSRTVYLASDVGRPKVEALAGRLRGINPDVEVTTIGAKVQSLGRPNLHKIVSGADLVVAATDDRTAQVWLDQHAYQAGIPAVFPAAYPAAHASEVIFTVPGLTGCFNCATAQRDVVSAGGRERDYGTGGLVAEPALGIDILHGVTVAAKIAIGLLDAFDQEGGANESLSNLVTGALARHENLVISSTVPQYDFFPELLPGATAQWAYQTAWIKTHRRMSCPICGEEPIDVVALPAMAPNTQSLTPAVERRST